MCMHEGLLILVMSVGNLWVGRNRHMFSLCKYTCDCKHSMLCIYYYVGHEVPKFTPVSCLVRLALADSELWSGQRSWPAGAPRIPSQLSASSALHLLSLGSGQIWYWPFPCLALASVLVGSPSGYAWPIIVKYGEDIKIHKGKTTGPRDKRGKHYRMRADSPPGDTHKVSIHTNPIVFVL